MITDWFDDYVIPVVVALMLISFSLPFLAVGIALLRWALS